MSTKQRGDVEKITPIGQDTFYVNLGGLGGTVSFTRDEFRRIWEAGNVSDQYVELSHLLAFLEAQP